MASSYCINALCEQRQNSINASNCNSCGASLLFQNQYRLIKNFRPDNLNKQPTVYEGIDINSGESVIAKVVEIHSRNCPNLLKKEQEILACFPIEIYPKRISSHHYFEFQPDPEVDGLIASMLILPKIEGTDSGCWVEQNGPIDQAKAVIWIKKLMPYLKRLREMAVLHRDIKPSNIIVDHAESLTLIDYGAARKQDDEYMAIISGDIVDSTKNEYRKITRVFSAGFTAPEQNQGKPIPQSDYFSLGRTVMYWISGVSPSELIDLDSNQIDWTNLQSPHNFDRCFLEFLERLTHPNPARRPLTLDDIEVFIETRLPELIQEEQQKNSKKSRIIKAIANLTGGIGVALLGLTGLWIGLAQTLYSQGLEALDRTQSQKARAKFETVIKVNPVHSDALYYLGLECQKRGDEECAERNFLKSLKWSWNPSGAQYQLGVLSENQGDYDDARLFYQKSLNSKQNPEAYNRLARLERQGGNLEKAQQFVQAGLKIADDDDMRARILAQQGQIYFDQKKWLKAEEVLEQSSSLINMAESVCLLPKISEHLNRPQYEVDGRWYTCFYSPNEYPEGADLKKELLEKALPSLFSDE